LGLSAFSGLDWPIESAPVDKLRTELEVVLSGTPFTIIRGALPSKRRLFLPRMAISKPPPAFPLLLVIETPDILPCTADRTLVTGWFSISFAATLAMLPVLSFALTL